QTDRPGPDTDRTPSIAAFSLGPFQTNCYVVRNPGSAAAWIVDAGFDPSPLIEFVRSQSLRPQALILTHAHADHIAGVDAVLNAFPNLPIHIHPAERAWLSDPHANLSAGMGLPVVCRSITKTRVHDLQDADTLTLDDQVWRIAHTPGHSPGSVSLINEEARTAIVGDVLF
ncbi:MAG: MBL fold metallo-hydrolase, partial [Phycisphaerales bacterium]|nr:MBL fold metallo-hydrolase [Phycisphaerales bacterium]